jgi:hypothetical protein
MTKSEYRHPSLETLKRMPPHIKTNFAYNKTYSNIFRYNSNADFIVIGGPGSGKSSLAQRFAFDMDPRFNIQRIVYSTNDLIHLCRYGEVVGKDKDGKPKYKRLIKGSAIIFDETAGSEEGADSRSALTKTNKRMSYLKTIYRDYKYIVFYIAPAMSQIDKNIKLVATTGVIWTKEHNPVEKVVKAKFYWCSTNHLFGTQYNQKAILVNPLNSNIYKIEHIVFPYSPKHIFKAYALKKKKFMDEQLERWLASDKEVKEKDNPKGIKDYFEGDLTIKDQLVIDGKYDWGLVSMKLGVGSMIANKITKLLNKGVTTC